MEIERSAVHLHAHAQQHRSRAVHERLQAWRGAPPQASAPPSVQVELSPHAAARLAPHGATAPRKTEDAETVQDATQDPRLDARLRTLARMIEALTGLRVRVFQAEDWPKAEPVDVPSPADGTAGLGAPAAAAGWGLAYDRVEIRIAAQSLTFEARGQVTLADGRTIDFRLGVQMQSTSVDVRTLSLRAGDAVQRLKDPLVLSLDGAPPALTDTRFAFDLDADGAPESVPFVAAGSGFLALDRNGNGTIDDGRELFGAIGGDGFAELATLDHDGNGWIDAADPAFERLLVWTREGSDARDRLQTLAQAGVGALYLGRVGTPFALGEAGRLRSSGVYLTEAGLARPLQQIDLAV